MAPLRQKYIRANKDITKAINKCDANRKAYNAQNIYAFHY